MGFSLSRLIAGAGKGLSEVGDQMGKSARDSSLEALRAQNQAERDKRIEEARSREKTADREMTVSENEKSRKSTAEIHAADRAASNRGRGSMQTDASGNAVWISDGKASAIEDPYSPGSPLSVAQTKDLPLSAKVKIDVIRDRLKSLDKAEQTAYGDVEVIDNINTQRDALNQQMLDIIKSSSLGKKEVDTSGMTAPRDNTGIYGYGLDAPDVQSTEPPTPSGMKQIGTSKGKPVYEDENGNRFIGK